MKLFARLLVAVLVLLSAHAADARHPRHSDDDASQSGTPGDFDYYLLSLSWSPDYCDAHPNDTQQCGARRYGFVLHGLWPQYSRGYPQSCSDAPMPAAVARQYADLYPSPKLMAHEWPKHGTCSGLAPDAYLALSKRLKDSVQFPPRYQAPAQPFRTTITELQHDIAQANPSMTPDSITMTCSGSGRFLQEIHLCYSKDGHAVACGADVQKQMRRSCGQPDFLVKSIR
ncbi:ribonuclease T2 family protein [Pararobbsia silviterrae]|uniref:Ribonuclease n=1 Tax=Pararobbsia silviterrae TaxID=1792498 RepID=A0A494XJG7_9BURK|nr:ribonuclease T2 [Pararobbsia silviterrae]RKP47713.1 ribonuclease [Pararobbsia silviterrae]